LKTFASTDGVTWYDTNITAPFAVPKIYTGTVPTYPSIGDSSGKIYGGYQVFNNELHVWGGTDVSGNFDLTNPNANDYPQHYAFNGTSWRTVCTQCPYGNNSYFNWVIFRERMLMVQSMPNNYQFLFIDDYLNVNTTIWAYGETDDCLLYGVICANGGTCIDGILTHHCSCQAGYSGLLCQTDINECASNPCNNLGTCFDGVNSFSCSCIPGYSGATCQTEVNECSSSPCQFAGNCTDLVNGFHCQCIPGFSGFECQTDIDECSSSPCQNGTYCVDHVNAFTCSPINACLSSPCQNGLHCVQLVNASFNCVVLLQHSTGWQLTAALLSLFLPLFLVC